MPRDLILTDFNGDGRPDMASVNHPQESLQVRLNAGGGDFGSVFYNGGLINGIVSYIETG